MHSMISLSILIISKKKKKIKMKNINPLKLMGAYMSLQKVQVAFVFQKSEKERQHLPYLIKTFPSLIRLNVFFCFCFIMASTK